MKSSADVTGATTVASAQGQCGLMPQPSCSLHHLASLVRCWASIWLSSRVCKKLAAPCSSLGSDNCTMRQPATGDKSEARHPCILLPNHHASPAATSAQQEAACPSMPCIQYNTITPGQATLCQPAHNKLLCTLPCTSNLKLAWPCWIMPLCC